MKRILSWLTAALLLTPLAAFSQASLSVAEAKLGKGVQDREITEEATDFAVNEKAYLWLRLTGGPSDPIQVTWKSGDHTDPCRSRSAPRAGAPGRARLVDGGRLDRGGDRCQRGAQEITYRAMDSCRPPTADPV
jgi:hypothetical protein